jgi:hypothetical protein
VIDARKEPFGKQWNLGLLDPREEPVGEASVSGLDLGRTCGGHNERTKICLLGRQRNASTDRGMYGAIFSAHSTSLEYLVVPGGTPG